LDFEKLKQWMELAQKYQVGDFWNNVFDQETAKNFFREFSDDSQENKGNKPNHPIDFPPVDIFTVDSHIVILVEIPGVDKNNVQITVSGQKLNIRGISRLPFTPATTIKSERIYGEFHRTIELPEPADGNQIRAKHNHGLLIITYPRRYEAEEPIIIE
jgi:HSP20 family protein